uniref:Uncharacterized protein n=1 Tax=Arundo donax TaxID=35708 RepID=A0A0A9EPK2_ARUDO
MSHLKMCLGSQLLWPCFLSPNFNSIRCRLIIWPPCLLSLFIGLVRVYIQLLPELFSLSLRDVDSMV